MTYFSSLLWENRDLRNVPLLFMNFSFTVLVYINNSRYLAQKYARIFVRGHYLFREANSFPRAKLEENSVSYEEQIMSKDKHPSIFSLQMEAFLFIILQIFFATRAFLKIGEYLTIRPVARKGYGSIAHKAKPNGLLTCGP